MAKQNIIAVKKAGLMIATGWLDRACKEAGYLGTAVVHDGDLVIHHQKERPTVEALMKVQEHFKDTTVIFNFGENVKTSLEEDMQPFLCVLDKDKGHKVAVLLTGDFNGYAVKDSSHTNEYHCFEDFLNKKLPKVYRSANEGLQGFLTELNDPITQQDLSNSWTNRGFISFLTTEGEAVTIANKGNIFKRDYAWGSVSDSLGYEEKTDAPAKVEEKKLSLLDKLMLKKEGKAPPAPEGIAETAVSSAVSAITAGDEDKFEFVSLPKESSNWTNKDKIKWWIGEVGYKPDGYKDMKTKVKRTKGTKVGVLAPLSSSNVKDAATPGTEERKVEAPAAATMKVDPKTLPEKKDPPENASDTAPKFVSMENMPILSPKQKLKLKQDFMQDAEVIKILGDDFKAMAFDPKRLKEFEDNYPKFTDAMGLDDDTYLSFEALLKLGAIDVKALAIIAFNNQNDKVKSGIQLKTILSDPQNKIATKLAM